MNNTSKIGIFLLFLVLFWATFIFIVALGSLPYNPISPSHMKKLNIISIIPEGWAFFTRSPRETNYYIYKLEESGPVLYSYKNSSYKNAFGLIRTTRGQGVELSLLLENLHEDSWIGCDEAITNCTHIQALAEIPVDNNSLVKSLCGVFVLQKKEPVPWAWGKSLDKINMPSKIIKLNITCH